MSNFRRFLLCKKQGLVNRKLNTNYIALAIDPFLGPSHRKTQTLEDASLLDLAFQTVVAGQLLERELGVGGGGAPVPEGTRQWAIGVDNSNIHKWIYIYIYIYICICIYVYMKLYLYA